MLAQLVKTVGSIEESPADEVEATTKLTTELLRALHVGNLFEQLVGGVELALVEGAQAGAGTHLVDPLEGIGSGTADFVLTLCGTQQHVAVAHQAQVDTAVQTCYHLVVETGTQVGVLGNGQTAKAVVGDNHVAGSHLGLVAYVTIAIGGAVVPSGLVGAHRPVEARVERTVGSGFGLIEVVEPGRNGEVGPAAKVAGAIVTLDGVALCGVRTGVHRCPLVVGTLRLKVEELHLEDALVVVLEVGTFLEVGTEVVHQLVFAIEFVTAVGSTHDVLQHHKGFAVFVAHHQCAGIVAGSSTAGGTALAPLAAFCFGGQQVDGFQEVFLYLVEHALVLGIAVGIALSMVSGIKTIECRILAVVGDEGRVLVVTGQVVVGQSANEECLTLDALVAVGE